METRAPLKSFSDLQIFFHAVKRPVRPDALIASIETLSK